MKTDSKYYDYCRGENPMVDTDAIKKAVTAKGLEHKEFAEEIGISRHTLINRYKYGNWTVLEAYKVCELLGIPLSVFFRFPERL